MIFVEGRGALSVGWELRLLWKWNFHSMFFTYEKFYILLRVLQENKNQRSIPHSEGKQRYSGPTRTEHPGRSGWQYIKKMFLVTYSLTLRCCVGRLYYTFEYNLTPSNLNNWKTQYVVLCTCWLAIFVLIYIYLYNLLDTFFFANQRAVPSCYIQEIIHSPRLKVIT